MAACASNPFHPCFPLQLWCWQQKSEYIMNSSWKPVIISSSLMCPRCDSQVCFIQPPTRICTCHLQLCPAFMLTSEEAGCPPTLPVKCDQLDKQVRSLFVRAVIDSRHREPSYCLSHYQATWGKSTACSVRYQLSVLLHFLLCFWFCPSLKPSQGVSTVSPQSSPLVLQLHPHMRSGRSSAAFVDALTDGNRNSSTNRPIHWLTGEH